MPIDLDFDRDTLLALAGLPMLMAGQKMTGLTFLAKGYAGLERRFRDAHPDGAQTLTERWQEAVAHYDETHQNETNRKLHRIGLGLLLGGTGVLCLARPFRAFWLIGAVSCASGWALGLAGHYYEGKPPQLNGDPLSYVAGPLADWLKRRQARRSAVSQPVAVVN